MFLYSIIIIIIIIFTSQFDRVTKKAFRRGYIFQLMGDKKARNPTSLINLPDCMDQLGIKTQKMSP